MAEIDQILVYAKKLVDEAEVSFSEGESAGVDIRKGKIHIGSRSRSSGLAVRIIKEGRIGVSSTTRTEHWKECVDAAISSSHLAGKQDWGGLPLPERPDTTPLCYDPSVRLDDAELKRLVEEMISPCADYPVEIPSGSAGMSVSRSIIANSSGVFYEAPETSVSVMLEAISGQSTGFEYQQDYCIERIRPAWVGEEAASLAAGSAGGQVIPSGTYDLVLSPHATAQFLSSAIAPALSGRNIHAGRSRFADALGQQVAAEGISLVDDPYDRRGLGSTAWDDEAVMTSQKAFIENGRLVRFAYDLKTAYRYHKESTGNAVSGGPGGAPTIGFHNLVLTAPHGRVDEGSCIYVHDVVGAHTANPLSGDFSVELSNAFFLKDGTREYPVKQAMWSGNTFDILRHIESAGDQGRALGRYILPLVRVNDQTIIGM